MVRAYYEDDIYAGHYHGLGAFNKDSPRTVLSFLLQLKIIQRQIAIHHPYNNKKQCILR